MAADSAPGLPLAATLAALPAEWPHPLLAGIQALRRIAGRALVVLDDDPTGTQTVHGVPVLTTWSPAALQAELAQPSSSDLFYLLTNSRSLPPKQAQSLNAELGRNLIAAAQQSGRAFTVISRSDSTLRGHFPAETDALAATLGGGFDLTLVIPAFLAGGRYTIADVHYVARGDRLVPAAETEFARDQAFGYTHSNLREWVVEKSGGRINLEGVASVSLEALRTGGPEVVAAQLLALPPGTVCVANAAGERDLEVLAVAALQAEAAGLRLLYRTAASFVRVYGGLPERPLLTPADLSLPGAGGGLIVAGSYVPQTTAQLAALRDSGLTSVEVSVANLLDDAARDGEVARAVQAVEAALRAGQDALLFTSRALVTGSAATGGLEVGQRVSEGLVAIVSALVTRPRYVLAKGGITSSDIATRALDVRRALVLGQVRAGVPVWQLGPESRWPGLPYIVFPGNVGGPGTLAEVVAQLRAASTR